MTIDDYLEALTDELRERDIPGARIGQILAEAQSHLAESGETPETAFGSPSRYAQQLAAAVPGPRSRLLLIGAIYFCGGILGAFLVLGGIFVYLGWQQPVLGLPGWALIGAGLIVLVALWLGLRRLIDHIVDPRTGKRMQFPLGVNRSRNTPPAD